MQDNMTNSQMLQRLECNGGPIKWLSVKRGVMNLFLSTRDRDRPGNSSGGYIYLFCISATRSIYTEAQWNFFGAKT